MPGCPSCDCERTSRGTATSMDAGSPKRISPRAGAAGASIGATTSGVTELIGIVTSERALHVRRRAGAWACWHGLSKEGVLHECNRPVAHGPIARGQANVHICRCGETWTDE